MPQFINGFAKKIIKWIFQVILAILPSVISAQHYAVLTPINDSLADYYVYADKEVLSNQAIRSIFASDTELKSSGNNNAVTAIKYYFTFYVKRPVHINQNIDGWKVFAVDPEKTVVRHYAKQGTGTKVFLTDLYKGGITVKDAKTVNRSSKIWTYNVYCYDATGLFCVAICNIVVK
jgi:uncharacterized protein YdhG (YjbR/CyaY superfamily)